MDEKGAREVHKKPTITHMEASPKEITLRLVLTGSKFYEAMRTDTEKTSSLLLMSFILTDLFGLSAKHIVAELLQHNPHSFHPRIQEINSYLHMLAVQLNTNGIIGTGPANSIHKP